MPWFDMANTVACVAGDGISSGGEETDEKLDRRSDSPLGELFTMVTMTPAGPVAHDARSMEVSVTTATIISSTPQSGITGARTSISPQAGSSLCRVRGCIFHVLEEACDCLTRENLVRQEAILAEQRHATPIRRKPRGSTSSLRTMHLKKIMEQVDILCLLVQNK